MSGYTRREWQVIAAQARIPDEGGNQGGFGTGG
jgi:hypothetical protein